VTMVDQYIVDLHLSSSFLGLAASITDADPKSFIPKGISGLGLGLDAASIKSVFVGLYLTVFSCRFQLCVLVLSSTLCFVLLSGTYTLGRLNLPRVNFARRS
jgi:hypothetical protein